MPTVTLPANVMAASLHQAFFGVAPQTPLLEIETKQVHTDDSGAASGMAAAFVNASSQNFALQVLTNLNITASTVTAGGSGPGGAYAVLLDALAHIFNIHGLSARGQIVLNIINLLANLKGDATYGVVARDFDQKIINIVNPPAVESGGSAPVADTTAPTLSSSTPAHNALSVAVGANIVLTFSEAVAAGTGAIVISENGAGEVRTISVTDTGQVTISGSTVTINPTADLHAGVNYTVGMASGVITDTAPAHNPFAGLQDFITLNFDTAVPDTTPPTASAFTSTATTVGATSNEAGILGLYNGATLIGATTALTANTAATVGVAAQTAVVNATLKVLDAAGNAATATQSVVLGTTGADTFTGTASSDFMYGFGGNDTLTGGLGDDTFNVDAGTDTLTDLATGDILKVSAGAVATANNVSAFVATAATVNAGLTWLYSATAGSAISVASAMGTRGFILFGSDGVDSLTGSAKADSIVGGKGADIIDVGTGNDTIEMSVRDTFAGAIVSGTTILTGIDRVTGMSSGDRIVLVGVSTTFTGAPGTTIADATGNTVSLVRGGFVDATKIFTVNAAGADTLLVYDADSIGAGTNVEAIVLVGSADFSATVSSGTVTLAPSGP